ncbi:hypothetical protein H2248_011273 [Termitomyces sp. 'cryptogamus']|nr:hypothetical protein H2248_011273 [Termitomyces sp. 'cryptogamus']
MKLITSVNKEQETGEDIYILTCLQAPSVVSITNTEVQIPTYTKLLNVVGEAHNTSPSSAQRLDKWVRRQAI